MISLNLLIGFVLVLSISTATAGSSSSEETDGEIVIHATNQSSVPSIHYIVDAVECLKEAYEVYATDPERAKLYAELYQEKHSEDEWNVVFGYTALHINSKYYVETSVTGGGSKSVKKGDEEKDKKKTTLVLIFSTN